MKGAMTDTPNVWGGRGVFGEDSQEQFFVPVQCMSLEDEGGMEVIYHLIHTVLDAK